MNIQTKRILTAILAALLIGSSFLYSASKEEEKARLAQSVEFFPNHSRIPDHQLK